MNPFILAGLIFGAIGLIQEAMEMKADPNRSKVVKPEKKAIAAPKTGDTIVNVGGQQVKQPAAKVKKEPEKPAKEPPPSDG